MTPLTFHSYNVTTNMWGIAEQLAANTLPYPISICVEAKQKAENEMSAVFTWSLPEWDGVLIQSTIKAYPSIVYGHELHGATSGPSRLPLAINESSRIVAKYDVTVTSTGQDQTFFDVVYTSSPNSNNITVDIVVDVKVSPIGTSGSWFVEDVVIDGIEYKVWKSKALTAPRYSIWFAIQKDNLKGTMRLKPFNDYLISRGFLSANDFVETIDFGTEVITGTGKTLVNSYSVIEE